MFFRKRHVVQESICVLPQSNKYQSEAAGRRERMSLCISKKGSLTIEAALILPVIMSLLIILFSFFQQYAAAAELKVCAAAEAKKIGAIMGCALTDGTADIIIYKTEELDAIWDFPFVENRVTQSAVCRAWVGFTELQTEETYVYITPEGSVYHLYSDCSHLDLSIERASIGKAKTSKNIYGQGYTACELCREPFGMLVYITEEGTRYHSERTCSSLKRTVRQIALSQAEGRSCCIRCMAKGE